MPAPFCGSAANSCISNLVLHDSFRDTRAPTHELTVARDVLRTRRRIAAQSPDWALSTEGIRILRQTSDTNSGGAEAVAPAAVVRPPVTVDAEGEGEDMDDLENVPCLDYTAIDAVLARSEAAIENATRPGWSGAAYCARPKACQPCCRRSMPSMPWNELSVL